MLDEEGDEINNENGVLDDALDEENQVIDENDSNSDNRFPEVSEGGWLEWFARLEGNEFLCEIDRDFITNKSNLIGIKCEQYLDTLLSPDAPNDATSLTEEYLDTLQAVKEVYGKIHKRFIQQRLRNHTTPAYEGWNHSVMTNCGKSVSLVVKQKPGQRVIYLLCPGNHLSENESVRSIIYTVFGNVILFPDSSTLPVFSHGVHGFSGHNQDPDEYHGFLHRFWRSLRLLSTESFRRSCKRSSTESG